MRCTVLVVFCALLVLPGHAPAEKSDVVRLWARKLGDELWRLSEALTKSDQIRVKYKEMNASVKQKDGKQILESALQSVSTMLTRKINAVKCIHATAEQIARDFNYSLSNSSDFEFQYCSAKYSTFEYENGSVSSQEGFPNFAIDNNNYTNVTLEKDSHFYDINVNTNISCVHVPTNIYYREEDALNAILWSKGLNDIFIKNYQSDPSLAWQYFGSSHGILRFYPGMQWSIRGTDTYDCRVKSWYIEAATCSKDVIVLFDVSGSMTGFKNYVARRTLKSLLDTLSNNDYVNVYTFKNETKEVVSCFQGLVQATKENIETLTDTLEPKTVGDDTNVHNVPLEGYGNLTTAYITAFKVMKERRTHCNVSSTQGCNQMVMVITDYVPGNLSEVFENHNREYVGNNSYIPVRVFTYLIGKEVTNVMEIQQMACTNRGFFVHIHSVEEVQQQVLKYINVIARPMILEGENPPPTWTHANIDDTRTSSWNVSGDLNKPDEDKLVTSVAIPAFDYFYNERTSNDARLLGVAGTDVPIDSIAKLCQPNQLGVNGYSFIVSNNGYLLLHPLLIATINGELQRNYNSVDFVEVEQVDDGKGARELGDKIKQLRENLVNGVDGSMPSVEILYHYDSMRRIARVKHDFYFNKLEGTPFSMGISLPRGYGDTELMLKDNPLEAQEGKELTGINVTDYFRTSYRIHPDWVYCKYHYLEGHETPSPEVEIWKFLVNISKNEIDIRKRQYTEESQSLPFSIDTHCGNATIQLGKDDYYCNEDLVKQLVFDAKLSNPYFRSWKYTQSEWDLALKYNVTVRFIATSSGLTRWDYIFDKDKNEWIDDEGGVHKHHQGNVFGDIYHNTIEETWYKAAVLQHMINKESLVISTPLPVLDDTIQAQPPVFNDDGDVTITATYAIFYKDGESETPASVVGFQYSYSNFLDRFLEITDNKFGKDDKDDFSCRDGYDCYVIDSSGYIVLNMEKESIGKFFGTLHPLVLQSLLEKKVFDYVDVYNYQALCHMMALIKDRGGSWKLLSPFNIAGAFIKWLITEVVLLMTNIFNGNMYSYSAYIDISDDDDYLDKFNVDHTDVTTDTPMVNATTEAPAAKKDEKLFSCDHRIVLYILNQSYFLEGNARPPVVSEDQEQDCHPAYWATYVPKTNLLLVVVKARSGEFSADCPAPPDTTPRPTVNSTTSRDPCHKLDLGGLPRRRLEGCFTYHDKERNITACGRGTLAHPSSSLIFTISCIVLSITKLLL